MRFNKYLILRSVAGLTILVLGFAFLSYGRRQIPSPSTTTSILKEEMPKGTIKSLRTGDLSSLPLSDQRPKPLSFKEAAETAAGLEKGTERIDRLKQVIHNWIKVDPEAVLKFLLALPDNDPPKVSLCRLALQLWQGIDPEAANHFALEEIRKNDAMSKLFLQPVLELVLQDGGQKRYEKFLSVLRSLPQTNNVYLEVVPPLASVMRHDTSGILVLIEQISHDRAKATLYEMLGANEGMTEGTAAIARIVAKPDSEAQRAELDGALGGLYLKYPEQAVTWFSANLRLDGSLDVTRSKVSYSAIARNDYQRGVAIAMGITDERLKRSAVLDIYNSWRSTDPDAASNATDARKFLGL